MKLALVFGLVAVALAAHSQWEQRPEIIRDRAFRAGKHYTYQFDGQLATGLPHPSTSQSSSTRLQSLVSLVFEDDRTVLLKLQKTRVGAAHRDLVDAREVRPFAAFEETLITEEQKEQLALPIRFRYEHGIVSDIEFDREDQPWSANIKRAVLNMLQLNLGKKSRTDEAERTRTLREEEFETVDSREEFFTAKEITLEGDCEVAYTINRVNGEEEKLRVAKSTNFEKCNNRVDIRYNYRFGEPCHSCEQKFVGEEKNTESATVLRFELNGNMEEFLIREVELKSHYLFAPFSKEQQFIGSVVASKLTLIKIDSEKSAVSAPKSDKKELLVYSTEWEEKLEKFRMTGEESLLKESPFPWMTKKMEIARQIVSELKREIVAELQKEEITYQPEANHQIARLVEVLRVMTKEELKKIAQEMKENEQMETLFHDILAITGTKNSIELMTDLIKKREISSVKAASLMKTLINIRNPSEKIVDELMHLCKSEVSENSPVLKQSCYLTVGSLLNGLCGSQRDRLAMEMPIENKKPVCPRQMKEKYVDLLETIYRKAETRYEKILAIKTMANAGMDLIVFPLEKIIKDAREEKTIRLQAIDALRQLRTVMPRKLQALLMPVYKNIREYPEIRVAAFHQIMQTLPERFVIDQITEQLAREPSHQVHAFVYSALKSFAKSDLPCEKDMARDIEHSLKLARIQPRKYLDSALLRSTLYSEEYLTGASLNWATLFSNDSVLPKEVMASLETVFVGEWNKYLAQVGFAQQNVDQLLYKMLEKMEESELKLEDVIVRGKRAASPKPSEMLKQLMKKMNIRERRFTSDKAHAMLYLRYKDLDYAVLPIDEEVCTKLFKNIFRNGKLDISEFERVLTKGYAFNVDVASFIYEKSRMIPTTLGLPIEIVGKLPTVATIEGKIKLELEPKSGKGIDGLKIHLIAKPKIAATHVAHIEMRSPIVSTGIKMLHAVFLNTPIDMTMELKWEKNLDTKIIINAPTEKKEEQKLAIVHVRPVTYVRYENDERKFVRAVEKTVYLGEEPVMELEKEYGQETLGLRFAVRGSVHRHLIEKMQRSRTLPIFLCENHVEVTMETTPETPREYKLHMTLATFDEDKMLSEQPEEFSRFFENKDDEELFEVEDSEFLDEDEKERRGEFSRYVKDYKNEKKIAYKHRIFLSAEALGSRTERRAQMELKSLCDYELTYCKFYLEAVRSPMEGESRKYEISASLETLFPEPVMSLKQLHEQKHREAHAIIDAKWGAEEKNTMRVKIQAEQSKEQQKWQRLTIRKAEEKETLESLEKLELASRLNQLKIVADYKIRPECLVQMSRVSSLLKAWAPLSATIEPRYLEKTYEKEGRLVAKLSVEPQSWRYLNLTVESPSEKLMLENIRLPFRPTFLSIEKTQPLRSLSGLSRRLSEQPVCEVSSKKVNTFDEVVYRAPITSCYSVLAKDCTEKPAFAVLMKNIRKNSEEKKLKIVTEDKEIVFELIKEEIVVKVDGKRVEKEEKLQENGVEKRGEVVVFENEDIYVRFDGYKAEIKLNEYYKNQQCGICGHYDGEYEGEFRRADNEETDEIEEFHRSFLIKDDEECEMEEEKLSKKENYKKFERSEESLEESRESSEEDYEYTRAEKKERKLNKKYSSESDETVEPQDVTRVIEYGSRVCFSKQAVPECPRKTFEGETEQMKVKFACLERSSSEARRLLREARRSVVDVEHLPHSFVEPISVPKTCTVY